MSQFRVSQAIVHIHPDAKTSGYAAAMEAAAIMRDAIKSTGIARIVVGTGNSQDHVIDAITRDSTIDWKHVEVFHLDEYVGMSMSHPASFRGWLKRRLVDLVHPKQVYYLAGDAPDLAREMQRYAVELTRAPIDLAFVGFGENGHIAFNDPHVADLNDPLIIKTVEMDETCRSQQVGEGHFESLATCPREAITLTCPAILRARHLVCVVPDHRKAKAVHGALCGPVSTACPASAVREHPHASVYLDQASASLLPKSPTVKQR